ncbi:MAG TPA: hypothetical protein ENK26_10490 [Gammaproteobacteria bacterium]|nr:hypothetical protein [Gammaproteobacteria bacterium]
MPSLGLSFVVGVLFVWLFAALKWWFDWRAPDASSRCRSEVVEFRVSGEMAFMGLAIALLGSTVLLLPIMIPDVDGGPGDWLLALLMGAIMGAGVPAGLMLWFARVRCCAEGVVALTFWGAPRFLPWASVKKISLNGAMQSYQFHNAGKPLYAPARLDRPEAFLEMVRRHAPDIELDPFLIKHPGKIPDVSYLESLNRGAPLIAAWSLGAVLLSFLLTPVSVKGLAFSAGAGALLALHPVYYNLFSRYHKVVANILQFLGMVAFGVLGSAAQRLFDPDHLDGYSGLGALLQALGAAMLVFALLVLASRRFKSHAGLIAD